MTRRDYFGGFEGDNKNRNNSLNILGITVKKYLWDCKNLKKLPYVEESRAYIKKCNKIGMKVIVNFGECGKGLG